ncbi:hypothetical protein [Anaerolinea sp.]|uniref:hypothetical protein n=1 Tax=Anaerolinea sp. TaxID=1872519 RepID=UPI002610867B|nr:hypothetical protein [uncultured Anaerolinea sp.]
MDALSGFLFYATQRGIDQNVALYVDNVLVFGDPYDEEMYNELFVKGLLKGKLKNLFDEYIGLLKLSQKLKKAGVDIFNAEFCSKALDDYVWEITFQGG